MKDAKVAKALEKRMDTLIAQKWQEIYSLRDKRNAEQAILDGIAAELESAGQTADAKEYQKARKRQEEIKASIAWYNELIEKKQAEPLVSKEEYEQGIAAILGEHGKAYRRNRARVLPLLQELKEIADDETERTEYENKVLRRWQHEIYKDLDRNGSKVFITEQKITARPFNDLYFCFATRNAFKNLLNETEFKPSIYE